jgi:histone deacetylase 1/2
MCNSTSHTVVNCWYRYDDDAETNTKSAGLASSYGYDTNWYVDSGASDHITADLKKITVKDKYNSGDQVHTANGSGMSISAIGHSVLHTLSHPLHLKNILHVPGAHKSLVSVHKLVSDNDAYLELHPNLFLIKDRVTKRTLHQGRCKGGLYPLEPAAGEEEGKQVFGVTKLSTLRWHSRLGHPAFPIVKQVLRDNQLPYLVENNVESVCDPCQRAKSHQLPYAMSDNVSTMPLQLIHSHVWGPAPVTANKHVYYVSFIDDFSKYTWIYLIKRKSEVFEVFRNFQSLVERKFDKRILAMQTDWGGEYERLNSFFQ